MKSSISLHLTHILGITCCWTSLESDACQIVFKCSSSQPFLVTRDIEQLFMCLPATWIIFHICCYSVYFEKVVYIYPSILNIFYTLWHCFFNLVYGVFCCIDVSNVNEIKFNKYIFFVVFTFSVLFGRRKDPRS